MKIPDVPTRIHFSEPAEPYEDEDGNQVPWYRFLRHYIPYAGRSGKGTYVECGPECVVCAYTSPQAFNLEGVEIHSKLSKSPPRPCYAVAGWVEEWFHPVQYYIDDNDHEKGTFRERERCQGRGCEFCNDGVERVFGKKFYTILSPNLWDVIFELQGDVELHCECGSRIYVPSFVCPECQYVLVDSCNTCEKCGGEEIALDADSLDAECTSCNHMWSADILRNESILKESDREHVCGGCKQRVIPERTYACVNADCACVSRNIFQCQLTLKTTGERKDTKLHVVDWKFADPDPRLFDPQHQGDDPEWGEKIAEGNRTPMRLDELLAQPSPGEQITNLNMNIQNPFISSKGGTIHHKPRDEE